MWFVVDETDGLEEIHDAGGQENAAYWSIDTLGRSWITTSCRVLPHALHDINAFSSSPGMMLQIAASSCFPDGHVPAAINAGAKATQESADAARMFAAPVFIDGAIFAGSSMQLGDYVFVATVFRNKWVGALHPRSMYPTRLRSDLCTWGFEAGFETLSFP